MKLNISTIKAAKPDQKPYRLSDGKGLFLLVNPNGSKWWRFHYRFNGKQKTLSMGVFPDISLSKARQGTNEARQLILDGTDPSEQRKENKAKANGEKREEARLTQQIRADIVIARLRADVNALNQTLLDKRDELSAARVYLQQLEAQLP